MPDVRVDVADLGAQLRIRVENDLPIGVWNEESERRVQRIRSAIGSGAYMEGVASEGGTGFMKLRRVLGADERRAPHLDFGYSGPEAFFVEFDVDKHGLAL